MFADATTSPDVTAAEQFDGIGRQVSETRHGRRASARNRNQQVLYIAEIKLSFNFYVNQLRLFISVFQEVREIHDDLTEMNNLVSQMTDSVDHVKHLRSSPRLSGPPGANRCSPQASSKRKLRDMDEDEMVEVTYRVLKRACHLSLARAEGDVDVSLIV